jgi:hypothetical protein
MAAVGRQLVQRHEFPSGCTHVVSIAQAAVVSAGHAPTACNCVQSVAFGNVTLQRVVEATQTACVRHWSPRGSSPQPHERPACIQGAPSVGACPGQGEAVAPPPPEVPAPPLPTAPPEPAAEPAASVPAPAAPSCVGAFSGVPPHSTNTAERLSRTPSAAKSRSLIVAMITPSRGKRRLRGSRQASRPWNHLGPRRRSMPRA